MRLGEARILRRPVLGQAEGLLSMFFAPSLPAGRLGTRFAFPLLGIASAQRKRP